MSFCVQTASYQSVHMLVSFNGWDFIKPTDNSLVVRLKMIKVANLSLFSIFLRSLYEEGTPHYRCRCKPEALGAGRIHLSVFGKFRASSEPLHCHV
jgi:hypothetical protein